MFLFATLFLYLSAVYAQDNGNIVKEIRVNGNVDHLYLDLPEIGPTVFVTQEFVKYNQSFRSITAAVPDKRYVGSHGYFVAEKGAHNDGVKYCNIQIIDTGPDLSICPAPSPPTPQMPTMPVMSGSPTPMPTKPPTKAPTNLPTHAPTHAPTFAPTASPAAVSGDVMGNVFDYTQETPKLHVESAGADVTPVYKEYFFECTPYHNSSGNWTLIYRLSSNFSELEGNFHIDTNASYYDTQRLNRALWEEEEDRYAPFRITAADYPKNHLRKAQADTDDGRTIDIMVVYTPAAAQADSAIEAKIVAGVAKSNLIFNNSQVDVQYRLVYMGQVAVNEVADLSQMLTWLQNPSDGVMDEVHGLRDRYGADMVQLAVADGGGYCGLGFVMSDLSPSFETFAYSVVAIGCYSYYSNVHEANHCSGLSHDVNNNQGGQTSWPYAYGYLVCGQIQTLMAYSCNSIRLPYLSSSTLTYNGLPLGNANANNALALTQNKKTVANFRASKI